MSKEALKKIKFKLIDEVGERMSKIFAPGCCSGEVKQNEDLSPEELATLNGEVTGLGMALYMVDEAIDDEQ